MLAAVNRAPPSDTSQSTQTYGTVLSVKRIHAVVITEWRGCFRRSI